MGAALIFAGTWWIYPPAALILTGVVIIAVGFIHYGR